nr:odorant receptor [Semanotus bifasciatus]
MSLAKINVDFVNRYYRKDYSMLKFLCIWVDDGAITSIPYMVYFFVVNVVIRLVFTGGHIIHALFNSDTVMNFASHGYTVPAIMIAIIQSYCIFKHRHKINGLYAAFSDDIFQPKNSDQLVMVGKPLKLFARIKVLMVRVVFMANVACVITPLFYKMNEQDLPFPVWFPFDISGRVVHTIVHIHQCFGCYYIAFVILYTEIMFVGFSTFITLQCDLLCDNLKKIDIRHDIPSMESLKRCIHHHWKILKFIRTIEEIFNVIYFAQFFGSTLVICQVLFLLSLVEVRSMECLFLIVYQVAIYGMLLMPCWFSSEMTRKSEYIPLAAYECAWPDATPMFKKELMYFMHITQKPIELSTMNLFRLSVGTFLSISKSAFSYYQVLSGINAE